MKKRYKIPIIVISVLLGISFMPVIVSNLYCDYLTDSCTSRITGVGPGGVYLPAEWGTKENCHVASDNGTIEPCRIDIAQINWPFPPRIHEQHESICDEMCPDSQETFHGQPLSYWQNLDGHSLVQYYKDVGRHDENFFDKLGLLLTKKYFKEKLEEQNITTTHNIEPRWEEGHRNSLPPRVEYEAVVNATDGKTYRLTVTVHGNVIQNDFQIREDNERRLGWTPAFEYNRVQINGTDALQICSLLEIICLESPVFAGIHRHDKDYTYFYYHVPEIEYLVKIDDVQICYTTDDVYTDRTGLFEKCVDKK